MDKDISSVFTDEITRYIEKRLAEMNEKLFGLAVVIDSEDVRRLQKMGNYTSVFVEDALRYAEGNPQVAPGFLDIAKFKRDVKLAKDLKRLILNLKALEDALKDTANVVGAQAYAQARAFYDAAKNAEKNRVSGMETIVKDLKKRFEQQGKARQK
jgi:hypothetical protein